VKGVVIRISMGRAMVVVMEAMAGLEVETVATVGAVVAVAMAGVREEGILEEGGGSMSRSVQSSMMLKPRRMLQKKLL
jgi:hypothetical protein